MSEPAHPPLEDDPGDPRSSPGEDPLAELVAQAQAGEPQAEGALYERLRPFLARRLRETRSRRNWFWLTDLDDAVNRVFAQFFLALRAGKFTYRDATGLEGFLLRTGFFVVMNLKDKARDQRWLSLHDEEEGGLRFDVADFARTAPDDIDHRECLEVLAAAVAALNENRRDVIERTLLGQPVRQICAETGRSGSSVSGLKFNALKELRDRLVEQGFLERCGELLGLKEEA
ncbi:MAG: sigma-70 family RNA polymerase sigma factor [Planctomycetes bacterium]|nr:sigma-70 family RNA polymerase sigma factor [Planctomycetota bacterium]